MVDSNEQTREINEEEAVEEIDLDEDTGEVEVDRVMREAEAAVEEVHARKESKGVRSVSIDDPDDRDDRSDELDRLRREVVELRDRSMRTLAEFDNFRKRTDREHRELRRYAASEPLRDFLEVLDNLERALAASGSLDDLKTGVEMILRQMQDLLRQQGVRKVPAEGEPFDPNVHEAVAREESAEVDAPTVVEEMQKGYVLHERLLRPSRVKVAVPAEEGA